MGRAIVRNPKVFLFDEPLSNLDAKLRVQMRTRDQARAPEGEDAWRLFSASPVPAAAHGFGQRYDLPLPLGIRAACAAA
jgi:ABC-type Na+ transport system ATPase subunit NatA